MLRASPSFFAFATAGLTWPDVAHAVPTPNSTIFDASPILDASSAPFMPYGPGSPSILRDDVNQKWLMPMEYRAGWTDPDCPNAAWGIALTMSTDPEGDSGWTPPVQLFEPSVDGSYKSCVTSHPASFWADPQRRTTLGIVFKAEGDSANCPVGSAPSRCVYTGIGYMAVRFNAAGAVTRVTTSPAPIVDISSQFPDTNYGFQSPVYLPATGEFYMLVQVGGDLYYTTSTNPSVSWSPLTLVMSPGTNNYPWAQDELFGQEIICGANGELISFQGGRTWRPGSTSILEAGWGIMRSFDYGRTWTLEATPIETWNDDYDWRHWSIVTLGPNEYYYFVGKKNRATGNLEIWRATNFSGAPSGPPTTNRICR